jgi:Tfp pilus assembly protein PilX
MNNIKVKANNESGQVSIITVIIFIMLFSVVVVSFSRIMVAASRQAVNDELAASAKAAAESGVEDAKRILSYCASPGSTGCDMLDKPIKDSTCTTVSNSNALMSAVQRAVIADTSSSIKVGDSDREEYLCLKMTMLTPDYLGSLGDDGDPNSAESVVVPLKFVSGDPNDNDPKSAMTIQVQWHNTTSDKDGNATLLAGSDLPIADKWDGTKPAVLRVEFVAVPKTNITVDKLIANTRAVTLRPSLTENVFGATKVSSAFNLDSWIAKTDPKNATDSVTNLLQVKCTAGTSTSGYACSTTFTIPQTPGTAGTTYLFDADNYDYYMRLQSVYHGTNFRLSAKDAAGFSLYFDHVQANVDVTGRATESQKRLDVRLNPSDGGDNGYQWWPDYAIDTAGKVCKQMSIEAATGVDNCVEN